MTAPRARLLLATCAAVLAALVAAWLLWPAGDQSADLEAVAPLATSTTPVPSTETTVAPKPPPTSTSTSTTIAPAPPAPPTRIRIPAVGIDARVVPVALRLDGQMEVPPAEDVGWYRLGPAPGGAGSSVLAAHIDQAGRRGAFFDLRSVPEGAEVLVDAGGAVQRFTVSAREQVAKADVRLDRYFTATGPARLTLITCGGVFDAGSRHYEDNIIVTAVPAP